MVGGGGGGEGEVMNEAIFFSSLTIRVRGWKVEGEMKPFSFLLSPY